MESLSWTSEQSQAINDIGHNLLVSAAAGSGKTAVLVQRIIELVVKQGVNIDEMLIVSFTDAAATQMKSKIYEALAKAGLDEQIERMGQASICTLSSFAYSVVKNYYHLIGVDPSCKICDDIKSALFKREAIDDLYEELFTKKDPDFLYFLDRYEKKINDDSVKSTILKLHSFLMSMPNSWEWADSACDEKIDKEKYLNFARSYIAESLSCAKAYYQKYTDALAGFGLNEEAEKSKDDIGFMDELISCIETNPDNCFEIIAGNKKSVKNLGRGEAYTAIKESIKAYRDYAKKCKDDAQSFAAKISSEKLELEYQLSAKVLKICFDLVKQFDQIYKQKKQEENLVDFSDIEHYALAILQNEIAKNEYREKFQFIFIDEYQDVNSVQEALIQSLVRDNNLFMVGDVKQSIYHFRLAEPQLFINHYEEYKSNVNDNNKAIDLNTNFRSKNSVINTVNDIFEHLMTKESSGIVYDDSAKLVKGSAYDGPINYPVKLEILDNDNTDLDEIILDLKNTEKEAAHAVSIINKYYGTEIYDDKKSCTRKLDYRDMVILLRTAKNKGEIYYKALVDAKIPVYFDRGEGFFETLEIEILLNILKIVANKKQDIPLVSVLTCPIFNFSADDLAEIRLAHKDGYFYEAFFECENPSEKHRQFIEMLELLKKDVKAMPLADFINKMMLNTGYADYCLALNGGQQRLANLKILVDKANDYEKNNLLGLSGFINFMETLISRKNVDMGQAKAISESMNCVRIMTIHKSKGLEFPFVLVAGINSKPSNKQDSIVSVNKDFGAAIRLVNPDTNTFVNTSLLDLVKMKNAAEERAEAIRLLYVAMTRAKDILVFTAFTKAEDAYLDSVKKLIASDRVNASGYFNMLYPLMKASDISIINQSMIASSIAQDVILSQEFEDKLLNISCDNISSKVSDVLDYPYFKEQEKHKKKYSVSEIAEEQRTGIVHKSLALDDEETNINCIVPGFIEQTEHKLSPTEKGTAYHAVMEHLPFTNECNDESVIKAFIIKLCENNIISESEAGCVDPKRIKAFFDTDIGQRALAAKEIYKEAPFTMKYNYDGQEVLVQGTIDCYFEEDGEYVLVDYKSNYIDIDNKEASYEHLRENYLPQLKLYKEALEKIRHKKVKQTALYLFGTKEIIEIKE